MEAKEAHGSRRVSKQQTSDATGIIVGTEVAIFSCASADRQHCRLSIWMVKTNTEEVIRRQDPNTYYDTELVLVQKSDAEVQ